MTTIGELLNSTRQLDRPRVPADVVPYDDTAYPDCVLPPAGHPDSGPATDAAKELTTLCETAVRHGHLGMDDFIIDDLPDARGAWILGCALYLAAPDDARFLWQYAAGVGNDIDAFASNAAYCLFLLHLAAGEHYAARFWKKQTGVDLHPRVETIVLRGVPAPDDRLCIDLSTPAILRVLSRLTTANRRRTTDLSAILRCVAQAFTSYTRDPEAGIPAPQPGFARLITIIVKRHTHTPCPSAPGARSGRKTLPVRVSCDVSEIKESGYGTRGKSLAATAVTAARHR
ncbi:hypothetical protein [Streptomyces uncialis]|uniref:hypothetical protein n=1 Tax=Streptomyces uncialis TaxID=1048205 RepID=UPI002F90A256|nr:hypothetical protein OG268_36860 [Streptomyces uncialis]